MGDITDKTKGPESPGDANRPYDPPKLTRVSLRPEEAVLGACKTFSTGGLSPGSCFALHQGCSALVS